MGWKADQHKILKVTFCFGSELGWMSASRRHFLLRLGIRTPARDRGFAEPLIYLFQIIPRAFALQNAKEH